MVTAPDAPKLSIIIPMYNEADNVGPLLERLYGTLEKIGENFEVWCIDDGSSDQTHEILRQECSQRTHLNIIHSADNAGQHAAIMSGFRHARGTWIITLDADLQNPPEEIPRLVEALRQGHDLVGTYREDRRDPPLRRFTSRLVNGAFRKISGIEVRDLGCMLRGYSTDLVHTMLDKAPDDVDLFIPALGLRHASKSTEIPVRHEQRAAGTSKYGPLGLLRLAYRLARTATKN